MARIGRVAEAQLRPVEDFAALDDRHAELDAERARAAREHDAERGIGPSRGLGAPAVHRVLEVTHHRESGGGEAHRQPIQRGERATRKMAEALQLRYAVRAPAAVEWVEARSATR